NHESLDAQAALDAATEGRAAFWTTQRYHSATARRLVEYANRDGLRLALAQVADDNSIITARPTGALLTTLVPLNAAAREEIFQVAELLVWPVAVPRVRPMLQAAE